MAWYIVSFGGGLYTRNAVYYINLTNFVLTAFRNAI